MSALMWDAPDPSLKLLFLTTGASESITLPLAQYDYDTGAIAMTYNFLVDWGDSSSDTITSYNQAQATHVYADAGSHVVTITGVCDSIRFDYGDGQGVSYLKVTEVQNWGTIAFKDMSSAFGGCTNMSITATDSPNLSAILDGGKALQYIFSGCTFVTGGLGSWNVSPLTNISLMLYSMINFNEDLNSWDTSNVTDMTRTFFGSTAFNGNITNWDVSGVTAMYEMFSGAAAFNQNIGGWVTSAVTNMWGMFHNATNFNQNIGGWDTALVNTMREMFWSANNFNQDIGGWDTGEVTMMYRMLQNAAAFDQDISGWDVSKVTNLQFILTGATSFSTANYDLLLNGWSLLTLTPSLTFNTVATYTISTSQAARDILTGTPNDWTINDGGGI